MLGKRGAKCFMYTISFTPHNMTEDGSFCYPHFIDDKPEVKQGEVETSFINPESGLSLTVRLNVGLSLRGFNPLGSYSPDHMSPSASWPLSFLPAESHTTRPGGQGALLRF